MSNTDVNKKLLGYTNPFSGIIARSAWDESPDVESINKQLTQQVLDLLHEVKDASYTKIMLVQGQPGIGKTHFISRLRRLSKDKNFLFVAVKPISSVTSIFSHIYREIFISLRKNTGEKYNSMEKLVGYIISHALINVLLERRKVAQLTPRLQDLLEKLQKDSTIILALIDQPNFIQLLKPISSLAIKRIEKDHPDVDITFLKVLFHTLDSNLRDDAMRWLQGDDIDDDLLEKLGVKESIIDEAVAQRVLHSLMTLSSQPILLCFDQLESIYDRFHDPNIIVSFFDVLVRLCNETPNSLILLMIQTIIWDNLLNEKMIPRASLDRIEFIESLNVPNDEEMVEIISKRLNTIWSLSTVQPEYKTYPFSEKYIKELSEAVGNNPRSVLKQLSIEFTKMKAQNSVNMLETFVLGNTIEPEPKNSDLTEFLSNQMKRIITKYKDTVKDESYSSKESYLETGLFDLFDGMKENDIIINTKKINDVIFKKKINDIDIILTVDNSHRKIEKWGIDICNTEHGQSFTNTMKMLQNNVSNKTINQWLVIRDKSLPVKKTWKKGIEILDTISHQGKLLTIGPEDNMAIFACKELLDLSSAGDLEIDNTTVSRKQVIPYLMKDVLLNISIINECFGIEGSKPEPLKKKDKTLNNSEIKEKILQQTERTTILSVNKFFDDFDSYRDIYVNIVNELVKDGKIIVLGSMENQIVVSKSLSDDVF